MSGVRYIHVRPFCDELGIPRGRCMLDKVCPFFAACDALVREKFRAAGVELPPPPDERDL
jgi:hypothetical protein